MKTIIQISLLSALFFVPALTRAADPAPALTADQAFDALKTYDEGQSTAPLLVLERFVGRASGNPAQRQQTADRLAAILASPQTSDVAKIFICQQLRLVGGDAHVPPLAKMLDDAKTTHMARIALQDTPGATAGKALLDALNRLKGDSLVGLINSLAARRETAAVPSLAKLLGDADAKVANAAAAALGKLGTKEAATALASAKPSPAITDAQLVCAAELTRNGNSAAAEPIYRKLCAVDQPLNIRLAALSGLTKTAPSAALPLIVDGLTASEPSLQSLAIELARNLPANDAAAALGKALPKIEGLPHLLALGALAERGDRTALATLNKLAADKDATLRGDASRELRRLRYAAKDAQVRDQIEAAVQESAMSVATLSPAPYDQAVIDQRKKQLAASLAAGDKLIAFLDCGVEGSTQEGGVSLRQAGGQSWLFPNSVNAAHPTFGSIAYNGSRVEFDLAGLDPQKRYALGFSWWDFDNGGRAQSVQFSPGESGKRVDALPSTKLPAFNGRKEGPANGQLPLDPALYAKGKMRVGFVKQSGPNAVVSELWLIETPPGSASATKGSLGGTPVQATPVVAVPTPQIDLTPFAEGTKILLVTGIDYPGHKWRETAPVIKGLLEQDSRLKVRIVEDPNALGVANLKQWDVVLLHFQNWETPGPGEPSRENLKKFVASGGGLGSVHFACGAWHGEWPEFQNILGRVWHGSGPGKAQHDAYGKFMVEIADKEHPVTKGMADFETTDELYTCLTGDAPIHLLAHAKSKVDKKYHPQAFVRDYGQGRVFLTTLGHDVRAYTNNPAVGELLRRGCAWAAKIVPAK